MWVSLAAFAVAGLGFALGVCVAYGYGFVRGRGYKRGGGDQCWHCLCDCAPDCGRCAEILTGQLEGRIGP